MTRKIRKTGTKSALIAGMLAAPMLKALAGAADYMKTPHCPDRQRQTTAAVKNSRAGHTCDRSGDLQNGNASESISLNFAKIKTEYKVPGQVDVAGQEQGHTVYRNAKGQFFYLDGATGDMK